MENPNSSRPLTKRPRNWGALPIVLVIAFFLLGAGSGYVLLQQYIKSNTTTIESLKNDAPATSDTENLNSNWKNYVNIKYFYSIQYPHNYRFREFPDTKTGAGFSSLALSDQPFNESIVIDVLGKGLDSTIINLPIEKYVAIAATREIQNYEKLASIKKIITASGVIGYETTWMVRPLSGGDLFESLPITYFELPYDPTTTLQVRLDKKEDLALYEDMIRTLKFLERK